MKIVIVGASGATGKLLVEQLLKAGKNLKIIVRPSSSFPNEWKNNEKITLVTRTVTDIGLEEMSEIVADCDGVASCLGHNLTFKGLFGKPRYFVTDAVELLCKAISSSKSEGKVKFVLMNSAGNINRDLNEHVSFWERLILGLLRTLLPPHPDNEKAADYLRVNIGQNHQKIEWTVVRPDSLIDETQVSDYKLHQSPTRSAIFDPGKTSRINVAHVMKELLTNEDLWNSWKGQMPVIYNVENTNQG